MPRYRIFPAIGIARVGADDEYFIGPEIPGRGPIEPGSGVPVTRFKNSDCDKVRKQAARFHLFESIDGNEWTPAQLPEGATIIWSVTLENRKSAVVRPPEPPIAPERPRIDSALAAMHIKGGTATLSGANAASVTLAGVFDTVGSDGASFHADVALGKAETDGQSRLIVTGGDGNADAPPNQPIGDSYYRNPKWYDDVSDGPVTARVKLGEGQPEVEAEGGAWVIVGPPDYAPGIGGIVTLFDVILQVGLDHLGAPAPAGPPSFDLDILPIIERTRRLRWVNDAFPDWSDPRLDSPNLRSRAPEHSGLRGQVRDLVLNAEDNLEGHTDGQGPPYRLRAWQKSVLQDWVGGDFDDSPASWADDPSAEGLTRASLEGAVGQGFCPGIEAGILVLDPAIFETQFDFRLNQEVLAPGDMTALMAQPWQADFLKCNTEWWPSQRPDVAAQSGSFEDTKDWIRGIDGHGDLVRNSQRLGFVVRSGADEVFIEAERDPSLAG